MPEPVAPPPAAPPAAAPPAAPPAPRVTFGGDKSPVEVPKAPDAPKPAAEGTDDGLKFDFGFEGEAPPPTEDLGADLDLSRPFDPALEEKLKDSPELLKAAKRLWYDNRAYRNAGFKTAQEAQQHLEKLNSLATSLARADGLKGLAAIEAEAKEWKATTEGIRRGDEGTVKAVLADVPLESLEKISATFLAQYKEKNGPGWARTMAQNFMSELRAQNNRGESVLTSLNRLAQNEAIKENPEAIQLLQTIAETVNQLDEISRQAPTAPAQADNQARDEIAREKRGIFVEKLSLRVMPQLQSAAQKAAKTVLGTRALQPEAFKTFSGEIQSEYNRLTKLDNDFQEAAKAYLQANDVDGFERLSRANIAKTMPTAARNINRKYQGFQSQEMKDRQAEGAARTEGAAGGSQAGGKIRYSGKMVQGGPDPAIVDWPRMRQVAGGRTQAEDMMFDHRFFVKGDTKNEYYW